MVFCVPSRKRMGAELLHQFVLALAAALADGMEAEDDSVSVVNFRRNRAR